MKSSIHHRLRARLMLALVLLGLGRAAHADPAFDSFFSNNGSFEFGSGSPPLTFSSSFSTSTQITGWTFEADGSSPSWFQNSNAEDGLRYVELTAPGGLAGWTSGTRLTGTAPFVIGDTYQLTFWAAGGVAVQNQLDLGFTSTFGAEFFNVSLPSYTQSQFDGLAGLYWQPYSLAFVASDTTMNFSIFAHSFSTVGQNSSIYLDNFSIAAVPEPSSGLLAGLVGVMALGSRRRRESRPRR
jgi:hypothetical protein